MISSKVRVCEPTGAGQAVHTTRNRGKLRGGVQTSHRERHAPRETARECFRRHDTGSKRIEPRHVCFSCQFWTDRRSANRKRSGNSDNPGKTRRFLTAFPRTTLLRASSRPAGRKCPLKAWKTALADVDFSKRKSVCRNRLSPKRSGGNQMVV